MVIVNLVPPTEEPIELSEAKNHLKVEFDDDDALIQGMIKASREVCENDTGRAILSQTWRAYLDEWPDTDFIELPLPPLQSVTAVRYTDTNLLVTTMATSQYIVETKKEPGRVVLAYGCTWPTATLNVTSPIEIEYVAGYGTPDDVPEKFKLGMKICLSDFYENRENFVPGQPIQNLKTADRLFSDRIFSF